MEGMKTKFHAYICFLSSWFDTTPEAENGDGEIEIPTVTLDGEFTLGELKEVLKKMEEHVKTFNN